MINLIIYTKFYILIKFKKVQLKDSGPFVLVLTTARPIFGNWCH